eukprot:8908872-Heterocapsa_arctica.AAC.1
MPLAPATKRMIANARPWHICTSRLYRNLDRAQSSSDKGSMSGSSLSYTASFMMLSHPSSDAMLSIRKRNSGQSASRP